MRLFFLMLWLGILNPIFAQNNEVKLKHSNLENGIAIKGYDAVAYFSNIAQKGDKKFAANFNGLTYYFSTEKNKNTFLKNPSKYEPQYGGWCAFAMGDYGKKVDINPKTFKIVDGKLYLFYNAYFNNTLETWNKDENNLKVKADKNWLNIINKK